MSTLLLESQLEIPDGIDSLESFRHWVFSDEFPRQGRIDYLAGRIEVDMSPDNLYFHSAPKSELGRMIGNRLAEFDIGEWFIDKTRLSAPMIGLSTEPDILLVTYESLDSGRASLRRASDRRADSFIEIEGSPDLVVEVVSDHSVAKDARRLHRLYFDAGVTEYWLVDARGDELQFDILRRGAAGFEATPCDGDGFAWSAVLQTHYKFTRQRNRSGHWQYRLNQRD